MSLGGALAPGDHGGSCSAADVAADLRPLRGAGPGVGGAVRLVVPRPEPQPQATSSWRTAQRSGRRLARIAARSRNARRTHAVVEARHRSADAPPLLPAVPAGRGDGVSSTPGSPASSRKPRDSARQRRRPSRVLAAVRRGIRRAARRPHFRLAPLRDRKHATRAAGDDLRRRCCICTGVAAAAYFVADPQHGRGAHQRRRVLRRWRAG